jgi:hypothetical protein
MYGRETGVRPPSSSSNADDDDPLRDLLPLDVLDEVERPPLETLQIPEARQRRHDQAGDDAGRPHLEEPFPAG